MIYRWLFLVSPDSILNHWSSLISLIGVLKCVIFFLSMLDQNKKCLVSVLFGDPISYSNCICLRLFSGTSSNGLVGYQSFILRALQNWNASPILTTGFSLINDFVSFLHQILAYLYLIFPSAVIAKNLELNGLTTLIRNPWTVWVLGHHSEIFDGSLAMMTLFGI